MKKLFFIAVASLTVLVSCKNKATEEQGEAVEFKTTKDKLSYALGAMNAKTIVGKPDANVARLDMDLVAKGFEENLSLVKPDGCDITMQKLFGPNYQDFNEKYAKEGAECLGKMASYSFYRDIDHMGVKKDIDMKMVIAGFKDGLKKKDTVLNDVEKQNLIRNFLMDLNVKNGNKMLAKAKQIKGAQVFDNGVIMEVIKDGNGASPKATDDVKVEYILMNAVGDTIQSSYAMKQQSGSKDPVALKLNGGVIPGWSFIVPKMKKGGKYRVYIPWNLAYGEEGGKESLCFEIELIDMAQEGTFVKNK